MHCYVLRAFTTVLIVCMINGCASCPILFTSEPSGVLVSAGGLSCKTPCELEVPLKTPIAVFTTYSGATKEVAIGHLTKRTAATRYGLAKSGEYTLGALALPLIIVGGIGALFGGLSESDTIKTEHPSRDTDISWIVAGSLVVGAVIALSSEIMADKANEMIAEIHVSFLQALPQSPDNISPPLARDCGSNKNSGFLWRNDPLCP